MAIQSVVAAAVLELANTQNQNDMGNTIFKSRKWGTLLGTATLLWLASCDDDELDKRDFIHPVLVLTSPQEGQVFANGDTIRIAALVSDNVLLNDYLWGIRDTAGVVVPDTITYLQEKMEDEIRGMYIVNGVTAIALWTVAIHAEDESYNSVEERVNIVVSQ